MGDHRGLKDFFYNSTFTLASASSTSGFRLLDLEIAIPDPNKIPQSAVPMCSPVSIVLHYCYFKRISV